MVDMNVFCVLFIFLSFHTESSVVLHQWVDSKKYSTVGIDSCLQ